MRAWLQRDCPSLPALRSLTGRSGIPPSVPELGAVLFALGALGRLTGRIGLSPIPLYLLAGLAFGTGGLLPLEAPEGFFAIGSQVGVVLLLLVLGLEYTADELSTNLRRQAPVGAFDLLLNGLPCTDSQMSVEVAVCAQRPDYPQ